MRWRCYIALLALLAIPLMGGNVVVVPDRDEEVLLYAYGAGTNLTSGQCAGPYQAGATTCGSNLGTYYATSNWTITRIAAAVGFSPWGTTEACDVDIDIAGTTTATFQFGASGLRTAGDATSAATFTVGTISAGDLIVIRHDDPVPDTYCVNTESCDCDGANATYLIMIHGYR